MYFLTEKGNMFEVFHSLFEKLFQSDRLGGASRSSEWSAVRKGFARKNPSCAVCGNRRIQVHHVVPFHKAPELELEESNLISLCQGLLTNRCHLLFGHLGSWRSWNASVREDAAYMNLKIENRP